MATSLAACPNPMLESTITRMSSGERGEYGEKPRSGSTLRPDVVSIPGDRRILEQKPKTFSGEEFS